KITVVLPARSVLGQRRIGQHFQAHRRESRKGHSRRDRVGVAFSPCPSGEQRAVGLACQGSSAGGDERTGLEHLPLDLALSASAFPGGQFALCIGGQQQVALAAL